MLAFRYFALHQVDVVGLETGLGGRLDATNVIRNPALSIITSIGLEHTRILGDTIELIALEKGGIIKQNCPVLVGPNVPHSTLRQCAQEKGASQYYTCMDVLQQYDSTNTDHNTDTVSSTGDQVDYDTENSNIAKAAILLLQKSNSHIINSSTVTDDIIQRGISHRPPCRFEIVEYKIPHHDVSHSTVNENSNKSTTMTVILDVAHNPPAMDYLRYKLQATYPHHKFRIVVGMSSDKDMRLCASSLKQMVQNEMSRIHLVEAAHPRAAKLEDIWKADPELQQYATYDIQNRSITQQIMYAIQLMNHNSVDDANEILVICGSVFLMAEAREALGFDEPRDSPYIAELAGAGVRHNQENFGNRTL
jgi:dihydrofolate synthase/folylpolyglutamate synthase